MPEAPLAQITITDHRRSKEWGRVDACFSDALPQRCPNCMGPLQRHGTRPIVLADIPEDGRTVRIMLSRPRMRCAACGHIHLPCPAWLDTRHRATTRLIALIQHSENLSLRALATQTGLSPSTIRRIREDSA